MQNFTPVGCSAAEKSVTEKQKVTVNNTPVTRPTLGPYVTYGR